MSLRLYGRSAQSAAVGFLSNGFPIYPIFGAEGEGAGNATGNEGQNSNNGGAGDGAPPSGQGGEGAGGEGNNGEQPRTYTAEEYADLKRRMQAADRAKTAAETELGTLKKKDMDEKTRAETERDEAVKAATAATQLLEDQAVQIDFLSNNKYAWHNPKAALKLLDRSEVTVADGEVTGLTKAIEALAKEHPYLVKPADAGGDGQGSNSAPPKGKSGGTPKTGTNGGGTGPDRKALEARFPALRGRAPITP